MITVRGPSSVANALSLSVERALIAKRQPCCANSRAVAQAGSARDAASAESRVKERLASLSEREVQVLKGVVQGQANKTIAFELGISPRTVEVYRANLMSKMQTKSLAELVRMVMDVDLSGVVGNKAD